MANFSLSPGVSVREINLTTAPTKAQLTKTGMVLRADCGPAMDVTSITNENDLVNVFGKPTSSNYQDWFQAWNFLQYDSSLYVVRPLDANAVTENAGVGINHSGSSTFSKPKFYNSKVAEHQLDTFNDVSEALYFINKEVTSNQRLAVAVCSSPTTFKSQLGLEYSAVVNVTDNTSTITTSGVPTLTNGSQVILNGEKLANVISVTQTNPSEGSITFDRAVSAIDVDAFYAVPTATVTAFTASFYKAGFTLKVGSKLISDYVVTSISNSTLNSDAYTVTFISVSGGTAPTFTKDVPVSSSSIYYTGTTAFNASNNNFGISAGDTSIVLQPGFIMEPGVEFTIAGIADTFVVASVDNTLNKINLVSPSPSGLTSPTISAGLVLSVTTPSAVDKLILGINYFDKVYDASLIKKTRKQVTNAAGTVVTIVAQSLVPFSNFFEYTPNWTNGEFVVVVLRKNDQGYYVKYESFTVSYNVGAKNNNGANIFIENVFNKASKSLYAKIGDKTAVRPNTSYQSICKLVGSSLTIYPQKTEYGNVVYDDSAYTQGDIMQAYTLYADPEQFDINIIQCHQLDLNYASSVADTRKDCIAVVAPYDAQYLSTNSSNDCTQYLLDNYGTQSENYGKKFTEFNTYSAFYGNMKYQYDKFNNVNRWINIAGDIAGIYSQTDDTNDPWYAPAGTSRGIIKNCIKLAFNPNKQNRDDLYVNAINPIMSIPGEGTAVVWGQKTATTIPSAMDRVNVRRLLIYLEKTIANASTVGIFEFNDEFTRTRLFNIIDPFLRSVKAGRGLYDYTIVIDSSNNGIEVIDANGLVIDIYLQPTKVAEFIQVTCAILPTGASFFEYVGTL